MPGLPGPQVGSSLKRDDTVTLMTPDLKLESLEEQNPSGQAQTLCSFHTRACLKPRNPVEVWPSHKVCLKVNKAPRTSTCSALFCVYLGST